MAVMEAALGSSLSHPNILQVCALASSQLCLREAMLLLTC